MVPHSRIYETNLEGALSKDNKHKLERVLRLREGAKFFITDGKGNEAIAILKKDGYYHAKSWQQPEREPSKTVNLFAALTKGERFEWVIEKSVEMGVSAITPIICDRCIVKAPSDSKLARWNKIALTAMMQSGGCILPIINKPQKLSEMSAIPDDTQGFVLHEASNQTPRTNLQISGNSVYVASGPEGGFSDSEIEHLIERKWQSVWLGKRLFRADTAPIIALANILSDSWF